MKVTGTIGIILAFITILFFFLGVTTMANITLIGVFVAAAFFFMHHARLKNFAFTLWVLVFVTASLFQPALFGTWAGVDLRILIVPLIQIIMFSIGMLKDVKGALSAPPGMTETHNVKHPFTGIRITDKGIRMFEDYCATVRDIVGWEIPIAVDHFGHLLLEDCIKVAQALDKFNLAWYEDMIPWEYTDQYVKLRNSCSTPILTGWMTNGMIN